MLKPKAVIEESQAWPQQKEAFLNQLKLRANGTLTPRKLSMSELLSSERVLKGSRIHKSQPLETDAQEEALQVSEGSFSKGLNRATYKSTPLRHL